MVSLMLYIVQHLQMFKFDKGMMILVPSFLLFRIKKIQDDPMGSPVKKKKKHVRAKGRGCKKG